MAEMDYSLGVNLIQSDEWRSWVRFLKTRIIHLKEKTVRQVRDKDYESARCTVSILDDIQNQIDIFLSKINEYQNQK